jgi:chromate transporter
LAAEQARAPALPVFLASLQLGCSAFGGPIAHIGLFRRSYVERRGWIGADLFASIVGLCQILPGPTSSQIGFLVGWHRAGLRGALAAWAGFTLPSAVLMMAFAGLAPRWTGAVSGAMLHGLQLAAVAVVAQAVCGMARSLCPDAGRATIAVLAGAGLLAVHGSGGQLMVLVLSAVAGSLLHRDLPAGAVGTPAIDARFVSVALTAFVALLAAALAVDAAAVGGLGGFAALLYRSGALVFGGGHVVLPLLHDSLVPTGWISDDVFMSGYGAAQALPGPLFAFGAYLGMVAAPPGASLGWALAAVLALFLPGLLIAAAGIGVLHWVAKYRRAAGAFAGINAAVVGVLAVALYSPVSTTALHGVADILIALAGFWLLQRRLAAPLLVVVLCVAGALCSAPGAWAALLS